MFNLRGKGVRRRQEFNDFNTYHGILQFDGKIRNEEFLDWLYSVDEIFEYYDTPKVRRVRLVSSKLRKYALVW